MMTTSGFIHPFQEAYDYQTSRTPVVSKDYAAIAERWRPQAITVAGLERYDSILTVDRMLVDNMANNETMSDFAEQFGKLLDEQDGLVLSPSRIELIHWNSMRTAEAAGAYRQMMETVEDRPIFWYYGPDDGPNHQISSICRPIHKIKVRYDDPILQHMWGPNHHHEYHEWVSLTEEEAGDDIFSSGDDEYPSIGGAEVRPAAGFDFNPAESMVDDSAFAEGVASLAGIIEKKASADYGLEALADLEGVDAAPAIARAIGSSPASIEPGGQSFREVVGIDSGSGMWALDDTGDGVRINRASFDELIGADADNAKYSAFIAPTIADPTESWWIAYETDDGAAYAKRYIKVFETTGGERISVVIDATPPGIAAGDGRTPGAWLWRMKVTADAEQFRRGLLVRSKVPRVKP